jgi:hypothetical protein
MSAAAALVSASAKDSLPILRDMLPYVIKVSEETFVGNLAQADKEQLLGTICGLFQTLFQRMEKVEVVQYADPVMNILITIFRNFGTVSEEALLACGAVAANIEHDFVVCQFRHLCCLLGCNVNGLFGNSFLFLILVWFVYTEIHGRRCPLYQRGSPWRWIL